VKFRRSLSGDQPFRLLVPEEVAVLSVSTPRSSNRTCGFPASGFPTGFVTRRTSATLCARGSAQVRQGSHRSDQRTV